MTDTEDRERSYTKAPTFNGTKSTWRFFFTKEKAYLARKGCAKLLLWTGEIPKEGDVLT